MRRLTQLVEERDAQSAKISALQGVVANQEKMIKALEKSLARERARARNLESALEGRS